MNPLIVISADGLRASDVADERIRIPNIRSAIGRGGYVERLTSVFPTLTWAIHASLITGRRPSSTGIVGNAIYDRRSGRRTAYWDPEAATMDGDLRGDHLFSAFRRKGSAIATICWPLTQGTASVDFNIPECYVQDYFERFSTPGFLSELKENDLPVHRYGAWSSDHAKVPMQDALTKDIAVYLRERHHPDVTFLHFLLIDGYQHDFGVGSPEAVHAIEYVDRLIGEVIAEREDANVVLFSDHGQASSPSVFYVDTWLREQGYTSSADKQAFAATSNGGVCFIYSLGASKEKEERLSAELAALPWIKGVWNRASFDRIGFPKQDPSPQGFLPDLVFELAPGHFVMDGAGAGLVVGPSRLLGMHGYGPDWAEMDGFLACAGPDFAAGFRAASASMLDIAPTLNAIYELGMEGMEGRVCSGLLRRGSA